METIDLGDQLEAFVTELVSEGCYKDRASVLRQGVLLLEERERKLASLNADIEVGLADARAGRTRPIGDAFDALEQRVSGKLGKR